MNRSHFELELVNDSENEMVLDLEVSPDRYFLAPNQEVTLHAIYNGEPSRQIFQVVIGVSSISVYPPGMGAQCIDFYVTSGGERIALK